MSSSDSAQMTKEQEEFLRNLEEEFKNRYTENDEEFKEVMNKKLPQPPVVENWEDRQRDDRRDNYRYRYYRHLNDQREPYYGSYGDRHPHSSSDYVYGHRQSTESLYCSHRS